MSFSFEDEEPEIHQAIQQAISKADKPILLFAAASNNRAMRIEPIGYPARDADHIICVNSSTVDDEKSVFSPRGITGRPNFSVIGEDIEAAWPMGLNEGRQLKRMSGTSCATPIAAGIAALILEFAVKDAPEVRRLSKRKAELWRAVGMRSVLKSCLTEQHTDGTYNFLKPWALLKEDWDTIATRIDHALKLKHKLG